MISETQTFRSLNFLNEPRNGEWLVGHENEAIPCPQGLVSLVGQCPSARKVNSVWPCRALEKGKSTQMHFTRERV